MAQSLVDMFPGLSVARATNVLVQCNQDVEAAVSLLLEDGAAGSTQPQRPASANVGNDE
jgi:hypothetical protein